MVALNFDPSQHEPSVGGAGQLVPEGWYNGVIQKTEFRKVRDKEQNIFLAAAVYLQELGKEYTWRFNLFNDNPDAVRIANGELSMLAHILGINGPMQDSAQLHNVPFQLFISLAPDKTGRMGNNVTNVRYANGAEFAKNPGNAPQGNPQQQTAPTAPAGYGAPPGQQQPYAQPQGQPPQQQAYAPPQGQPPAQQGYAPPQGGQPPVQPWGGPQAGGQAQPPQHPQGQGQPAPQAGYGPPPGQGQPPGQFPQYGQTQPQGQPPQQYGQAGPPAWGAPPR